MAPAKNIVLVARLGISGQQSGAMEMSARCGMRKSKVGIAPDSKYSPLATYRPIVHVRAIGPLLAMMLISVSKLQHRCTYDIILLLPGTSAFLR